MYLTFHDEIFDIVVELSQYQNEYHDSGYYSIMILWPLIIFMVMKCICTSYKHLLISYNDKHDKHNTDEVKRN